MSDELVEIERLADLLVGALSKVARMNGEVEVPTMRDRFAIAIASRFRVADLVSARDSKKRLRDQRELYAAMIYDLADALDAERRRRNEEDRR